MEPAIVEAVSRAKRFATGRETRIKPQVTLQPSPATLRAYVAGRAPGAPIFLDIESSREQPTNIRIVGVSVSAYTVMVVAWTPEYADVIAEILAMTDVVKGGHNFAFDQHAFRVNGCEVAWPAVVDTIQAEALLYPPFKEAAKRRWLSLATCVLRRFPGPHWKDPRDPRTQLYFRLAFPEVPKALWEYLYCGLDTMWNWLLWERQKDELERTGMARLYRDIVAPAGYTFAQMEDTGVPIDETRRALLKGRCEDRIAELNGRVAAFTSEYHMQRRRRMEEAIAGIEGELDRLWSGVAHCFDHPAYVGQTNRSKAKCEGCRQVYTGAADMRIADKAIKARRTKGRTRLTQIGEAFDSENANHWRALFFQPPPVGLGLVPVRMTKGGIEGVGAKDIEALAAIYSDVPALAWKQEIFHRLHQLKFVYEIPVDAQGRAHANFPLHKAENGRVASGSEDSEEGKYRASDAGNLQNITEVDRQIFCAPPGFKWVEIDGSQFEYRVMCWLARAMSELDELARGVDVHSENAAAIFGCKPEDAKKMIVWFEGQWQDARRAGKRPSHGWDYGLMDRKCGNMFKPMSGKPMEEIRRFLDDWAERTNGSLGVSAASWDRRQRAADRAAKADIEQRKFAMRMYEEANTLEAMKWRLAYFARRPGLAKYQDAVIAKVHEWEHTLVNPFGRVRKFWGWKWDFNEKRWIFTEREEALAQQPASTVGDMAKALMMPLARIAAKQGGHLVHMGHDSFSALIPDAHVDVYILQARQVAQQTWKELGRIEPDPEWPKVPEWFRCPFEAMVGQNWGKRHEHDATCKAECERFNPDGLVPYKEAA